MANRRQQQPFEKTIGRLRISYRHDYGGKECVSLTIDNDFDKAEPKRISIDETFDLRYMLQALLAHVKEQGRA